jgi:hypothetical protein
MRTNSTFVDRWIGKSEQRETPIWRYASVRLVP